MLDQGNYRTMKQFDYNSQSKQYMNKTKQKIEMTLRTIDKSFLKNHDKEILLCNLKNQIQIELDKLFNASA